ncbi:GntR family transcriptional regulator [Deinococcus pimensis]|uniref:GntR family transcriptional regulator n=1 Tax=Deinococcus pimensis TaxID=309888 RepID=UPI000481D2F3|nr:winged helix-turn-helix domain-containing protein [Deinococcus pimensis]
MDPSKAPLPPRSRGPLAPRADLDLPLDLTRGAEALPRQLARQLREAIQSGRLAPGTALPSSRALAATLGVTRGTIVEAYAQLDAEGYVRARHGSGTRVREGVAAPPALPSPRGA